MSRVGSPLLILFVDIYFHIYHMIQLSFFCKAEARLDAFLLFRWPTVSLYTPERKRKTPLCRMCQGSLDDDYVIPFCSRCRIAQADED